MIDCPPSNFFQIRKMHFEGHQKSKHRKNAVLAQCMFQRDFWDNCRSIFRLWILSLFCGMTFDIQFEAGSSVPKRNNWKILLKWVHRKHFEQHGWDNCTLMNLLLTKMNWSPWVFLKLRFGNKTWNFHKVSLLFHGNQLLRHWLSEKTNEFWPSSDWIGR